MPRPRRLLDVLLCLCLCGPLAIALAALSGLEHRWPDILAQFTAPALAPAIGGLVLAWAARLPMARLLAGLALASLLVAGWGQWRPPAPPPESAPETVRLYSANLYVGNDDVEAMIASIAEADADIVVLVEVGPAAAPRIDDLLAGYPHRVPARIGYRENVVASRHPLTALPRQEQAPFIQGAAVQTPIGPINVFAVHLTRPWPFQYQWGQILQVRALEAQMSGLQGPVVAAGDFNSVSTARIGRQVRDLGLNPAGGFPGTWPAQAPAPVRIAIDQVYASDALTIVSRRLGRPTGSDHAPVIVELARARP